MAIRAIVEKATDRTKFALVSLGQILRRPRYAGVFIISFLLFLFVFTFFRDGSGNWALLWSGIDFEQKVGVLGRVCYGMAENITSLYGVILIFLSIMQAAVVMQLIFTWRHREKDATLDGASTGAIGTILAFITLGCPSCGIGLLTPILTATAGVGAMAIAESISHIVTIIALGLMIFTIIRLGYIDFILISNEKSSRKDKDAKSN